MILTNEEVNDVLRGNLTNEPVKGYAIRIEGMTFSNNKGKILWKKKHHAMAALRVALEFRLKQAVKAKLIGQGFTLSEIYRDSEYKRAYDNFLRYLENNNMIQVIEIEW